MLRTLRSFTIAVLAVPIFGTAVAAACFSPWALAVNVESIPGTDASLNTSATEGCPALSRDGLRLYMASNRPGGQGNLDIWMATRTDPGDPWGAPANLGPEINTADNEFCPSPNQHGPGFMFVSNRPGGCGGDDIYLTVIRNGHWVAPANAGCTLNSPANEASPFRHMDKRGRQWLYLSSNRPGGFSAEAEGTTSGDIDLYVSRIRHGEFWTPRLVDGVNSANDDARPNVPRNGRELYFDSNRAGGLGGFDLYSSTRGPHGWNVPVNLGPDINSAANETRARLSRDRLTLYFGSVRGEGGSQDLFQSKRHMD